MPGPGSNRGRRGHWCSLAPALGLLVLFGAGPGLRPAFQHVANKKSAPPRVRNQLPGIIEVPMEEPVPEPAPPVELPPHRIPYTFHLTAHIPGNQHFHEENARRLMIEKKIIHALQNTEDIITHVDARLRVQYNYHKADPKHARRDAVAIYKSAGAQDEDVAAPDSGLGTDNVAPRRVELSDGLKKTIAPYHLEVIVLLKTGRQVIISKPRHAQATVREAADHTADALRMLMHAEKDRWLRNLRHPKKGSRRWLRISGAAERIDKNDLPAAPEVEAEIEAAFAGREEEELEDRFFSRGWMTM